MYAVFQIGNKQYRVFEGQVLQIERINFNVDEQIEFDNVLFIKDQNCIQIGQPFIKDMKILAKIINHGLSKKIKIIKFRRRKHYCKSQGHRQHFTKIEIIKIGNHRLKNQ